MGEMESGKWIRHGRSGVSLNRGNSITQHVWKILDGAVARPGIVQGVVTPHRYMITAT
jgi:hypothetical protein